MIDELVKLREIEYELNNIGMRQIAGDIGYLVSWLISPEYNNGVHKKPDPAGPNTIDAGSNNCPIPYIVSVDDVIMCTARFYANSLLNSALHIIDSLKTVYTKDVESTAFSEYEITIHKMLSLLDEEEAKDWEAIFPGFNSLDLGWPW